METYKTTLGTWTTTTRSPYPREVIGGSYADLHNPKALEGQFPPPLGVNRDS